MVRPRPPAPTLSPRASPRALAVLLHDPLQAVGALKLCDVWQPLIPATRISNHGLPEEDVATGLAVLRENLNQAGLSPPRVVLIGALGAENLALSLAFAHAEPICGGVMIFGSARPAGAPNRLPPTGRDLHIRLLWEAVDPVPCVAEMRRHPSRFRAAGLDPQGTVLRREEAAAGQSRSSPSPSAVRMAGAYLAELVAIALGRGAA